MDGVSQSKPEPNLNGNEKKVYELLNDEAMHIDQLALNTGLSTSEVLTTLLTLELAGHIRQMAGKMFTRI